MSGYDQTVSPVYDGLVYGYSDGNVKFDIYMDGKAHPLKVTGMDLAIGNVGGTPKFVEYVADDVDQQWIYNGTNIILASDTNKALSWTNNNNVIVLTKKEANGGYGGWAAVTLA